jgi:cytochrome c551/c552
MGCRNPYRISVDQHTGFLYWGEVGPDGAADSERGPRGYDEINQAKQAGNFGWPYFLADNKAYGDYDFATNKVRSAFDPAKPANRSPNNRGMEHLPPAQPAFWFYPRASACAGPVFHHADFPDAPGKLPAALDSCLVIYDWTSAWLRLIKLGAKGEIVFNEPWLGKHRFIHPSDMALDAKGRLYLLEYGTPWYDGTDGKLKRITYSPTPAPIEILADDPRMVGLSRTHAGTGLIASSTCLACHTTEQKSIGPAYKEVAQKYREDPDAPDRLARKLREGGAGAWGEIPMPPHPQLEIEDALQMIEAILALK